jgi:hypothetical protein
MPWLTSRKTALFRINQALKSQGHKLGSGLLTVNNDRELIFGLNRGPRQPLSERVEDPPELLLCRGFACTGQAVLEPTT